MSRYTEILEEIARAEVSADAIGQTVNYDKRQTLALASIAHSLIALTKLQYLDLDRN